MKAQEERDRQDREDEAQEAQERKVKAQGECAEGNEEEPNSTHEENDVSNRHMKWWQKNLLDSHRRLTDPADGARPSTNVACSNQSTLGDVKHRTDRGGPDVSQQHHAALEASKCNKAGNDNSHCNCKPHLVNAVRACARTTR